MRKFYRVNDKGIVRCWECDSEGNKLSVVAIIGQVGELLKLGILERCSPCDPDSWLIIPQTVSVANETVGLLYASLGDAKKALLEE